MRYRLSVLLGSLDGPKGKREMGEGAAWEEGPEGKDVGSGVGADVKASLHHVQSRVPLYYFPLFLLLPSCNSHLKLKYSTELLEVPMLRG